VALEYLDAGNQPDNIQHINRTVNLDVNYHRHLFTSDNRWTLMAQAGLTSSRLSHNGCQPQESCYGYRNRTWFTGCNAGLGLGFRFIGRWKVFAEIMRLHYQQSDKPQFEDYTFGYGGVALEW
jgi:hypothetical protein